LAEALNVQGQGGQHIGIDRSAPDHRLRIETEGGFDSNVLFNDLVLGLYRGGTIDRDVRQHSMDAIDGNGRAGYELGGRISYAWGDSLFGHASWQPRVSASYRMAMGMRFTEDIYHLTFFGNADLVDQTAHLGPSRFEQVTYRTVGFGIQDKRSGTYLEVALVSGQALNAADIRKADLYTAPDGRYLDLQLDGDYWASDTSGQGLGRSNGFGAAVNLQWNKEVRMFGDPATLSLGLRDLGAIAWNRNSVRANRDSIIHFEGIRVDDILDLDGLVVDRTSFQDSLGLGYTTGTYWRALPAQFAAQLNFGHLLGQEGSIPRYAYQLTVDQHYLPGYVPRAVVDRNFMLSNALCAGVGLGYGGFGTLRLRAGLDVQAGIVRVQLQTANVVGLVLDQAMGKSVLLGVEAAW
jgi:hypothetical protein